MFQWKKSVTGFDSFYAAYIFGIPTTEEFALNDIDKFTERTSLTLQIFEAIDKVGT